MSIKRLFHQSTSCPRSTRTEGGAAIGFRRSFALTKRGPKKSIGAALVELMFCLVILVPVLLWTIQMAYITDAVNTMSQLSYTVARYAATHGRDNNPTDEADNDYNDPNKDSVLYAAYQACQGTNIPYGRGFNNGSTNSYTKVSSTGATIALTYTAPGSSTPEGEAAGRHLGDTVTASVQFDMKEYIFMPSSLPGISTILQNPGGSITRTSSMVLIQ